MSINNDWMHDYQDSTDDFVYNREIRPDFNLNIFLDFTEDLKLEVKEVYSKARVKASTKYNNSEHGSKVIYEYVKSPGYKKKNEKYLSTTKGKEMLKRKRAKEKAKRQAAALLKKQSKNI